MKAMTFDEMDKMWHDIREKMAAETAPMTIEEKVRYYREGARDAAKRLGLKVVTETSRVKRRLAREEE